MAMNSPSRAMPIVNSRSESDALSVDANHAKPAAVISIPVRFTGRRHYANKPVPMNDHPTSSASAGSRRRSSR